MPSGEKKEVDDILNRADRLLEELKLGKLPIGSLLISFRELAIMLNSEDDIAWAVNEMTGYGPGKRIPEYRKVRAKCRNENPARLWPLLASSPEELAARLAIVSATWYETVSLIRGCGVLEQTGGRGCDIEIRTETSQYLRWSVVAHVEPQHTAEVLSAVKNHVTDFTLRIVLNKTMEKRADSIFRDTQEFVGRELAKVSQITLEKLEKLLEDATLGKPPNLVALGCRDLLQEFTDAIMRPEYLPEGVEPPKRDETRKKLKYVLGAKLRSRKETERRMLETQVEALEKYFDAFVDYVQKVGHPEGYRATKEDSKRCVMYTYLIVGDILKLLS
jgi:hypothetical protein